MKDRPMRLWNMCLGSGSAAILLAHAAAGPAMAQSVEPFYRGRTITIAVGFSTGGTYDTISRLLARHMPNHLPGKPSMIVQNMVGAGGSNALMQLYSVLPKDGTAIGMVARNYPIDPLFAKGKPAYEPARFNPIGSTSSDLAVAVTWHSSPVKTFADAFKHPLTVGATAYVDNTGRYPLLARNLTGAPIRIVLGYPGGNDVTAALERGEVEGSFGWSWGSLKSRGKQFLADKKLNIILQIAAKPSAELAGIPSIMEYAKTERDRQALEVLFVPQSFAWPFVAPPNIPADRLTTLRRAFDATMQDEAFRAEAARLSIEIDPVTGEEMAAIIARIDSFDRSVLQRVEELLAVEK